MRLTVVDAGPLHLEKSKIVAFAAGSVRLPTTVAVIEHPKHGVVLWDTGINPAVADPETAEAYWGPGMRDAFGAQAFARQHAVDAHLGKLGLKPADVRYVVYSHLHLDHAGGMELFPDAVHVVQREEIRYAMWPDRWTQTVYCQNDFRTVRTLEILEIEGDDDLFGDGTLKLLKVPGHSPGHQALLLDLPNRGRICLGGDVGHLRDGFEALTPMPWDWSVAAMSTTRMRMKQLERGGIPMFLSHDEADFGQLPVDGTFWD